MSKVFQVFTRVALAAIVASGFAVVGATAAAADEVHITVVGSNGEGPTTGFVQPGALTSLVTVPPATNVRYPTSDPIGWDEYTPNGVLFRAETRPGGKELLLYCAQVLIQRSDDYTSISRDAANIGNAGYVARLVASYYPQTEEPTSEAPRDLKIAAVQAAIWYFTDGYIVAESNLLHDTVEKIVNDTLAAGELSESPVDLSFSLNGPTGPFDVGAIVGPFTVSSGAPDSTTFTINSGAAKVFSNAAGTSTVAPGTSLDTDTPFWIRSDIPTTLTVQADGTIAVVSGLFFGSPDTPMGPSQTLISATTTPYLVEGSAQLTFTGTPDSPQKPPSSTPQPSFTTPTAEVLAETGSGSMAGAAWLMFALLGAGAAALMTSRYARRRRLS